MIAVDENGDIVDGDKIMFICGKYLNELGRLKDNTIVATVMSNLGFHKTVEENGMTAIQTAVGDRYVVEEMRKNGFSVGGEQSGHVLLTDYSTTGDGVLTALHLLSRLAEKRVKMSELVGDIQSLPQTMINVKNVDKAKASTNEVVADAVRQAEEFLGETGRVLLRPSGTEALVRVMVEAATQEQADHVCQKLVEVVQEQLSL